MPFIRKGGAFRLLNAMESGRCAGECRSAWLKRIQYALKTKSNPLDLTATERRRMTQKIRKVKQTRFTRCGRRAPKK
jgi:hypothetical protein